MFKFRIYIKNQQTYHSMCVSKSKFYVCCEKRKFLAFKNFSIYSTIRDRMRIVRAGACTYCFFYQVYAGICIILFVLSMFFCVRASFYFYFFTLCTRTHTHTQNEKIVWFVLHEGFSHNCFLP